jgi:hypothetical protein
MQDRRQRQEAGTGGGQRSDAQPTETTAWHVNLPEEGAAPHSGGGALHAPAFLEQTREVGGYL